MVVVSTSYTLGYDNKFWLHDNSAMKDMFWIEDEKQRAHNVPLLSSTVEVYVDYRPIIIVIVGRPIV